MKDDDALLFSLVCCFCASAKTGREIAGLLKQAGVFGDHAHMRCNETDAAKNDPVHRPHCRLDVTASI